MVGRIIDSTQQDSVLAGILDELNQNKNKFAVGDTCSLKFLVYKGTCQLIDTAISETDNR